METPKNIETKKNKITQEEMQKRLVQLFGQDIPETGKIKMTEKEKEMFERLRKLKLLGLLSPKNQKLYEKLEQKRRISEDGEIAEDEGIAEDGEIAEDEGISEDGEIAEDLKDYRQAWRENIEYLSDDFKGNMEEILEKLDQIPVKVETDGDGSRLIEFKLGGKKWKILDPRLKNHTDQGDAYVYHADYDSITKVNQDYVRLRGLRGDNVDDWENKELVKYVKEQEQKRGLHIAKIEEIKNILSELGKKTGLSDEGDRIAMLMYLTGMDGYYWLSMGDDENSNSQANSRSFGNATIIIVTSTTATMMSTSRVCVGLLVTRQMLGLTPTESEDPSRFIGRTLPRRCRYPSKETSQKIRSFYLKLSNVKVTHRRQKIY